MWRVDPLVSDNATWFQGLIARPTVEILDILKQNLSHSLPQLAPSGFLPPAAQSGLL